MMWQKIQVTVCHRLHQRRAILANRIIQRDMFPRIYHGLWQAQSRVECCWWLHMLPGGIDNLVRSYLLTSVMAPNHADCCALHCSLIIGSSVQPWMIVSCFILFFCISNVTATLSANSKSSDGVESRRLSLNNLILRRQSSFIHFISLWGTFRYLQERHAKKPTQMVSCKTALSSSDTCLFANSSRAMKGKPFVALLWDRRFCRLWIASIEGR